MRVIIPSTSSKTEWLKRTLRGLLLQSGVEIDSVLLVIDQKPWDKSGILEAIKGVLSDGLRVEIDLLHPPMKPKRSHHAVNQAIAKIHKDGNQRVLVMDDDYWMRTPGVLAKLVDQSREGIFVTPDCFDEADESGKEYWLPEPIAEGNEIRYFSQEVLSKRVVCDLSERGQHPMCGHPKIFFTGDFLAEKGYDVPAFQHYWWCDTDMYYRLKKRFQFIQVPVSTWHMNHPRYNPQMFQKPNARRFLERHQAIGEIAEPHLEAANNQLME